MARYYYLLKKTWAYSDPFQHQHCKNLKFKLWYWYHLIHSLPPYKPMEGKKVDVVCAMLGEEDRYRRICREAQIDTMLCLVHPLKTGKYCEYSFS